MIGPPPIASRSVTWSETMGVIDSSETSEKIGPKPKYLGGCCGPNPGVDVLPGKFTPPPTKPKMPRPNVTGESSLVRNEKPVARPGATPLSLRVSPYRLVDGKLRRSSRREGRFGSGCSGN